MPSRRSALSLRRLWYVNSQGHLAVRVPCATAVLPSAHRERRLTISQGTSDVRLDPQLNKKVWESGIKGVPFRLRVRISRKRNDEEGAKEKLYSYVQAVNVKDPKGLHTQVVEDA